MTSGPHLSDYALARLHAEEGSETERAGWRQHLEGCPACRERLAAVPARAAELPPLAALLARRRAGAARPTLPRNVGWLLSPRLLVGLTAAAACLLLLGVAVLRHGDGPSERGGPPATGVRLKGAYAVEWIVARAGGSQQRATEGFAFRVGDRVGLRVRTPRAVAVQVFAVDRAGRIEMLIPAPGAGAPLMAAGGASVLPESLELEAPLVTQRVFVVLAGAPLGRVELDKAVKRALVRETLETLTQLDLRGAWHLDSRLIGHPEDER